MNDLTFSVSALNTYFLLIRRANVFDIQVTTVI